ncbi:MAG: sigma-70 family RNA polymerase sigma factor [Bacilli bacterium]|nr:sigma-70 family RNA polymerase sigma factor [Bacilli bacterium]
MNDKEQLIEQLLTQMDKVFFYCVKRCNSRSDAEDLSQDILLDIMININKGIKIENFDYYIWQICKNHYSKYVAKKVKDRENIMFVEEFDKHGIEENSLDKLINSEKVSMINAAIKLLSSDYSEILYSYYIEDRSLSFIAEKLNLPLGTVKRRLFDIRNKLKEYLKMERLNGRKAFVPKKFETHRSGGANLNPEDYTNGLIEQNLLMHSYGNPCSLEDYSLEMGISLPYIENIVNSLEHATLLIKDENGKYLTNFIIVDKNIDNKVAKLVKQNSREYTKLIVEYCKKHFNEWKKLVDNPLLDDNKLMWSYLFSTNRKVEYLDCTKEETVKNMRKHSHIVEGGSWDFSMSEDYESEFNTFYINECMAGNGVIGVQGLLYPGQRKIEGVNSEALKCIRWDNSANWNANFELFGYLLKNKNIKYSDCVYTLKSAVDEMVEENYLKIENDNIKFNFVLLDFEKGKISKEDEYSDELIPAKQKRKEITKKIEEIFKDVIPEYLYKDLDYIANSYFIEKMRQHIVMAFEEAGLIEPVNEKRFVYNMFCWERK